MSLIKPGLTGEERVYTPSGPGVVAVPVTTYAPPPVYSPPPPPPAAGPGIVQVEAAPVIDYVPPPPPPPAAGPGIVQVEAAPVIDYVPPPPVYSPPPPPPPPAAGPGIVASETPMSIMSTITKAVKDIGSVATGFVTGGPVGAVAAGVKALSPSKVAIPAAGGAISPLGFSLPGGLAGAVLPTVAGYAASKLGQMTTTNNCGCNGSSGRDPCTHQRMTHQPAPLATFFGGCCPPGRTLRRKPFGRDICIKTPKMNPFNPHALARADRRVTTFARRAAPMLKDLGFQVSRHRRPKLGGKRRKSRRAA